MNVLFLLIIASSVWLLGYRFFAKFFAIWALHFPAKHSLGAPAEPAAAVPVLQQPVLLLGHHFAAITGVNIFSGTAIALIWGWIPAFLWVVTGTAVFSGAYQMASLWLVLRNPDHNFVSLTGR